MPVRTMLRQSRHTHGVPFLDVADLDKAIFYYGRFYGFRPVVVDEFSAVVRGHGATVLLRKRAEAQPAPTGRDSPGADAAILVRQPEVLRRRIDDWGGHLVPAAQLGPGWDGWFGFRDCYGNVVAVGPLGTSASLARHVGDKADSLTRRLGAWRRARVERRHLDAFARFHASLPDRRNVYYLHVNGGLLHWLAKTVAYVPEGVNLVVLGSAMPPDERAWAANTLRRPFHHVDIRLDEAAALEFLFAVNREHFGWLDLGCLVLNGRLFDELATIGSGTSLNCVWSWDSGLGFPLANAYLIFVNADVIKRIRLTAPDVGPGVYANRERNRQVEGRRCYTRPIPRALRREIGAIVPNGPDGLPAPPGGLATFETTMMYQIAARMRGFTVSRVRELAGFHHIHGGDIADDASDELFYIGGLSRADVLEEFSGYFHEPAVRLRYAMAEYLTLAPVAPALPSRYGRRLSAVSGLLADHGLPATAVKDACRHYLTDTLGLSSGAADAVVRSPATVFTHDRGRG